jgi:hypothetical protein
LNIRASGFGVGIVSMASGMVCVCAAVSMRVSKPKP